MSNSKTKKILKPLKQAVKYVSKLLIIALWVLGLMLFVVGFHNMDNGQNLRYVNGLMADDNITFSEYTSMGTSLTAAECYMQGFDQALLGGFILFALATEHVLMINKM